jgi:hypothetical protein
VAKKDCPSCGAEVPVEAFRCKHCFHDLHEQPRTRSGPVVFLGFVAAMMVVGAGITWYNYNSQSSDRVVVDQETRTFVVATKSPTGMTSERVSFDKVEKLEHVLGGEEAAFELVAVTLDGKRYILQRSEERPLTIPAQHFSAVIGKPLVEVRNFKGFGE